MAVVKFTKINFHTEKVLLLSIEAAAATTATAAAWLGLSSAREALRQIGSVTRRLNKLCIWCLVTLRD